MSGISFALRRVLSWHVGSRMHEKESRMKVIFNEIHVSQMQWQEIRRQFPLDTQVTMTSIDQHKF